MGGRSDGLLDRQFDASAREGDSAIITRDFERLSFGADASSKDWNALKRRGQPTHERGFVECAAIKECDWHGEGKHSIFDRAAHDEGACAPGTHRRELLDWKSLEHRSHRLRPWRLCGLVGDQRGCVRPRTVFYDDNRARFKLVKDGTELGLTASGVRAPEAAAELADCGG